MSTSPIPSSFHLPSRPSPSRLLPLPAMVHRLIDPHLITDASARFYSSHMKFIYQLQRIFRIMNHFSLKFYQQFSTEMWRYFQKLEQLYQIVNSIISTWSIVSRVLRRPMQEIKQWPVVINLSQDYFVKCIWPSLAWHNRRHHGQAVRDTKHRSWDNCLYVPVNHSLPLYHTSVILVAQHVWRLVVL